MAHGIRRRSGFVASKRRTTWVGSADQNFIAVGSNVKVVGQSYTPQTDVPSKVQPT